MEQVLSLLDAAKNNEDCGLRIESLSHLKQILLQTGEDDDPSVFNQFLSNLTDLQTAPLSPARKYLAEMILEIGLKKKKLERVSRLFTSLLALLNDEAPSVVRQSIASGTALFCKALQADKWPCDLWPSMEKFKDAVYPLAFRHGASNGVKFQAVKFLEITILLFANGSHVKPPLAAGHREILDGEASKNLGLMMEQLRSQDYSVKTSSSVIIVVINSVAEIAKKMPALCGGILTVLLDLNPSSSPHGHMGSVQHALKTAFLALLKCAHWGALPWRDRLLEALRAMNAGGAAEQALRKADHELRKKNKAVKAGRAKRLEKDTSARKSLDGSNVADADDVAAERLRPALQNLAVQLPPQAICTPSDATQEPADRGEFHKGLLDGIFAHVDSKMSDRVGHMVGVIGVLLAQGRKGCETIEIMLPEMDPDLLADVVIANMQNLPSMPLSLQESFSR